jgi:ABC-type polysaccharide/polyol phosphate export permease
LTRLPIAQLAGGEALEDLAGTLSHWRLWIELGLRDIKARYRRTVIGPFWTVLSAAIFILALGVVYSLLWHIDISEFLPYFSAGYISWILLTTSVSESCSAFTSASQVITSLRLPYMMHIFHIIWRNLIVFAHCLVVHAAVLLFFRVPLTAGFLLLPVGLALLIVNLYWVGLIIAIVCARFRDITQVITSVLLIALFVTPIFWPASRLDGQPLAKLLLADCNPAYHLIEVIRQPLLGEAAKPLSYVVLLATGTTGLLLALAFFSRYRRRIAYWL